MFRIDLLQNEWLMLAFIGGSALVLLMILWYVVYWRTASTQRTRVRVPAFLIVVYVAIALFAIGYVAARILYPPNW